MTDFERTIAALSDPEIYPHKPATVEIRQTHASVAFLAGHEVYKLKKPVDFGFLDYSTLERRRAMCELEVQLNQRLAPSVYLGVVKLVERGGQLRLGGDGRVVDYLVRMRRLNDDDSLVARIATDRITSDQMRAVARRIAEFHARARRSPEIDRFGSIEAVTANVDENFDQTRDFVGKTISKTTYAEIAAYAHHFLKERRADFEERIRSGQIRDGHGDLRADHVYIQEDGIQIIDCIEFSDRLRYGDVAADFGFLLMDLDALGYPDLADAMLADYSDTSGDSLAPVIDFYRCYRAYVRGKVLSFETVAPELSFNQRHEAALDTRRFFHLADRYAHGQRGPRLIIMCGLTGAGKSTLAAALERILPAFKFDSDSTRKRLAGVPPSSRHETAPDTGIYNPEMTERVYKVLLDAADEHLVRGHSVLLDASYLRRERRQNARALARKHNAGFLAIECHVSLETARTRLTRRARDPQRVSDGRWEIYLAQREMFEPLDDLPPSEQVQINTAQNLLVQVDDVLHRLSAMVAIAIR